MEWNRFDICEAWYLFAAHYHSGQWSETYEIFGRLDGIGFSPSPILSLESLSENGREIYQSLASGTAPQSPCGPTVSA